MKATTVQRNLSLYQFTHKRVEAIATEMRKAGLLPKAGRGLHAPNLSCEAAVQFALAVAGAERVVDAAQTARELAELVDEDNNTLNIVLATAVHSPHLARNIRYVRVMAETQMAEITYRDGKVRNFFTNERWAEILHPVPEENERAFMARTSKKIAAQGQGFCGRIGHIGGGVLEQMALDFSENDADDEGELIAE